ncbi:porin [Paraburkholderia sp. Tr-20389]|uniref:porin n=1 Tax=Paraburkholderia sp. Tr-20389 TaxID=2703903 RepID=UPI001982603D|nr:porin [Paraburkholderia sp. Tr-20389]MBN3753753.1 porin [Paraburkholderia sp. Tr-20389]
MKKHYTLSVALAGLTVASVSNAQTSVTLYGVVDNGIAWQNSSTSKGSTSGGHSAVTMTNGAWAGSRFGLKGSEDLGGGTSTIFQLEAGFNSENGQSQFTGGLFTRQAFAGLANANYGTLTLGRQYTAYYLMLSPYSPTTYLTGFFGAHPGDIDSLDTTYRVNNAVMYTSPKIAGFTFSASYALGGVAGDFNRGSTWSVAAQYLNGPFGIAAGVQRINNSTPGGGTWGTDSTTNSGGQPGLSALNNGYQTAQAQQRIAVTGGYRFTPAWDVSFSYSNVQYVPGIGSAFHQEAIFNTGGLALHWKPGPALDLAAGYSYTWATEANGIHHAAQYHQISLTQYYALSKRTGVYTGEAFTRANGQTLGSNGVQIINATATVGDGFNSTPSSSGSQVVVGAGILHRF